MPSPIYVSGVTTGLVLSGVGVAVYISVLLYDLVMYARHRKQPSVESVDDGIL